MALSRRRLLAAAVTVPAIVAIQRAADLGTGLLAAAARGARPRGGGTSADHCAQCGSAAHAMLDPGCPLAPRVRA